MLECVLFEITGRWTAQATRILAADFLPRAVQAALLEYGLRKLQLLHIIVVMKQISVAFVAIQEDAAVALMFIVKPACSHVHIKGCQLVKIMIPIVGL